MDNTELTEPLNFVENIVEEDLRTDKYEGRVHTRFPPEPNGYLHIGHAKSICLNFGIAERYKGLSNLRFDDTNPVAEDVEYVDSIQEDVKWLGFSWDDRLFFASDYYGQLHDYAVQLIKKGKAYVDDSTAEEIAAEKGTPTEPGVESKYRSRTVEENLRLFEEMKAGKYADGEKILRAKIDMASPNMHMRDPIMYRILNAEHHRTGDEWVIYPMYDFAHGICDSIEGITHSLCTLEFEVHRPLYEWFLQELEIYSPQQIEFAPLNLSYTVLSKRKLRKLVEEGHVMGWDDPRMPTVSGMRRRGYTPEAIRNFAKRIGVARRIGLIDLALLEYSVREDLNKKTARVMGVLNPLKLVITNYPEGEEELMEAINNPEDESMGTRKIPFSRELYIEKEDFREEAPRKFFRLKPDGMVRLKNAYIIRCDKFIKDESTGEVTEVHCTYFPESRSGSDTSGLKAKGVLHWVSIKDAVPAEVRLVDRLFKDPTPNEHKEVDFMEFLNEDSMNIITAYVEPSLKTAKVGDRVQFMRKGYFCLDKDSSEEKMVFNRTVTLKDNWAKRGK